MDFEIHIFKPLRLAYVRNYKVASKTIVTILKDDLPSIYTPGSHGSDYNLLYLRGEKALIEFKRKNQDFLLFTFVRNPYTRILSAYHDKLNRYTKTFEKSLHTRAKLYQLFCGPTAWDSHIPKVRYIQRHLSLANLIDGISRHGTSFDKHFEKQSRVVAIDSIVYDYIGTIENFRHCVTSLFNLVGLKDIDAIVQLSNVRKNSSTYDLQEYLDYWLMDKIYQVYEPDFVNFKYERNQTPIVHGAN